MPNPPRHPEIALPAPPKGLPTLHYRVSMPEPWTHNLEVEVHVAGLPGRDAVDLRMPSWTPGSYKIREFARNVSAFDARDRRRRKVKWERLDKDTWRVSPPADGYFQARFRVYAFERSVRTAHVDDSHAFFQPTNALPYPVGMLDCPATLEVAPWGSWSVACPLRKVKGKRNRWYAENYDELADAPVECADFQRAEFAVDGVYHEIVIHSRETCAIEHMRKDFPRIVAVTRKIFGGKLPYRNYLFLIQSPPGAGGGGLEHLTSQVSSWPGLSRVSRDGYEDFLSLIAHELFHAWNGKRLRPRGLGPFDYNRETYTKSLWIVEGITTYYQWQILLRAGLVGRERVLREFAAMIERYNAQPGATVMSLAESSFLAWIKLYLADENFVNSGVSYYLKGALTAMLLDLELRRDGGSLDRVISTAFKRFSSLVNGYDEGALPRLLEELTGKAWTDRLESHLNSTEPPPFAPLLLQFGLVLERERGVTKSLDGKTRPTGAAPWFGWELADAPAGVKVAAVRTASPASKAGISAADEVVAFAGTRVRNKAALEKLAEHCVPADAVVVALFRDDVLRTFTLVPEARPTGKLDLREKPGASAKRRRLLNAWLPDATKKSG